MMKVSSSFNMLTMSSFSMGVSGFLTLCRFTCVSRSLNECDSKKPISVFFGSLLPLIAYFLFVTVLVFATFCMAVALLVRLAACALATLMALFILDLSANISW